MKKCLSRAIHLQMVGDIGRVALFTISPTDI